MNLVFRHDGVLRQGDDYTQYPTDDPDHPWVFVSKDESECFLLCVDGIGNYLVRPLNLAQWHRLQRKLPPGVRIEHQPVTRPGRKKQSRLGGVEQRGSTVLTDLPSLPDIDDSGDSSIVFPA